MKPYKTVADPDLQVRGEPSHPDHEINGGGAVSKKIVSALWASVWSNNWRGALGGSGPSPGSTTAKVTVKIEDVQKVKHSKKYICL